MFVRTNVNFDGQQLRYAKSYCKVHHLSISELLRRALAAYMAAQATPPSMFGLLKGQLPDGLTYQRELRADED